MSTRTTSPFFLKPLLALELLFLLLLPLRAQRSAVAADEPLAAKVGQAILEKGGNAVDAAVAVGLALAVTYPQAGNLGGGGFMMGKMMGKEPFFLDFREVAPRLFRKEVFFDDKGNFLPEVAQIGAKAVGVPGTVKGLYRVWKEQGTLPWKDLVQPAIDLASQGFIVRPYFAEFLKEHKNLLERFPESRRILLKGGEGYLPGERLLQPELAETLKRIAERGADGFYLGETAERIERSVRLHGGWIDRKDLELYKEVYRPVIELDYQGFRIFLPSLPSSGGAVIAQSLLLLDCFPKNLPQPQRLSLLAEVMKLTFLERSRSMGDPGFASLPTRAYLSPKYAAAKASLITPGKPAKIEPSAVPTPWSYEKEETTHYSVLDKNGNMVAVTYTLNGYFGSGLILEETGLIMNNEIDDFGFAQGVANQFGLLTSRFNLPEPGKRMLSSMSPVLVTRGETPYLAAGAAGGPKIISGVLNLLINLFHRGMGLKEALEAPKIHHQCFPDTLYLEKSFDEKTEQELKALGYKTERIANIGVLNAVLFDGERAQAAGSPYRFGGAYAF